MRERRVGILSIPTDEIVKLLGVPEEFRYQGAFYDFDSNTFRFKFAHESFPVKQEGMPASQIFMMKGGSGSNFFAVPPEGE